MSRSTLMPAAYSDELREKVLAAIEPGEKKSQVSRMFNISRDTIDRWLKRCDRTGSVKAGSGYQRGHTHRIKDWDALSITRPTIMYTDALKLRQNVHLVHR